MATLGQQLPSLLDISKRTDPKGAATKIIETLTLTNPILQDAVWGEGNLPTGHMYTSRTGLPTVGWRRLNEGVDPGKSVVDNITETTGMLSGMSVVDVEVARLAAGGDQAFRASEDMAFLQSFNHEFARALFYESTKANPDRIHGIASRLNQLPAGTTVPWRNQVIGAGGSGTSHLTSMYLVNWSPDCAFMITPRGSPTGLETQDMGIQLWNDANSKKFRAYVTQWMWKFGLVIQDYRYVARICNIDTNALTKAGGGTPGFLFDHMLKAHYQIANLNMGRAVWYCNRTIAHWLHSQALNSVTNSTLTIQNIGGIPVTSFLGIPIKVCDSIMGFKGGTVSALTAEAEVTTSTS
jgi:hypothetical protein